MEHQILRLAWSITIAEIAVFLIVLDASN